MVADEVRSSRSVKAVYVASGSRTYVSKFAQLLNAALLDSQLDSQLGSTSMPDANRRPLSPLRIITLDDILAVVTRGKSTDSAASAAGSTRPMTHQHTHNSTLLVYEGMTLGRDGQLGMQGAVLDLWALASSYKLFRGGESTFGQLAASIHLRPDEVVVRDTRNSACKAFLGLYPSVHPDDNSTIPAFCTPRRGKQTAMSCACATPAIHERTSGFNGKPR